MRALNSTVIGGRDLRSLVLPYSHDAGMSELRQQAGGVLQNSIIQNVNAHQQLVYGSRVFGIRPY